MPTNKTTKPVILNLTQHGKVVRLKAHYELGEGERISLAKAVENAVDKELIKFDDANFTKAKTAKN